MQLQRHHARGVRVPLTRQRSPASQASKGPLTRPAGRARFKINAHQPQYHSARFRRKLRRGQFFVGRPVSDLIGGRIATRYGQGTHKFCGGGRIVYVTSSSLIRTIVSNFIGGGSGTGSRCRPALVTGRSKQAVRGTLGRRLRHDRSFSVSITFIDRNTIRALGRRFLSFTSGGGRSSKHVVASAFGCFGSPGTFGRLLGLRRSANVRVRI